MSQQINLFNPIFLKQRKVFSAITMVQALSLILLGSMGIAVYANIQASNLSKEAATTSAQLDTVQARLTTVNATYGPRQKDKSLEDTIQKTETDVKSLQQVMVILQKNEIGDIRGYAEYMRAFARQIVDGVWLTGFSIQDAGVGIGVQGRALQPDLVPMYINRLKREPAMNGKSIAMLEMKVPTVDKISKPDRASDKQQTQGAFIEFNLQSSEAEKESVAMSGVKIK